MSLHRLALTLVFSLGLAVAARAAEAIYTNWRGFALSGYDAVAYFSEGRPVEGSSEHTLTWMSATWRFASAEHLAAFRADPEKYAPQYGGYCAWAISNGEAVSADPEAWKIVDGRLYLNYSHDVQRTWEKDIPGNIARADARWPELKAP